MKLNTTYPLDDVLNALNKVSDKLNDAVEEMKREGKYSTDITRYVIEGTLTSSPYARVTFTGKDTHGDIVGYMETTPWRDSVKVNVKVRKLHEVLIANDDYSNITIKEV